MTGIDATQRLAALMSAQIAAMRARVPAQSSSKTERGAVKQKDREPPDAATIAALRVQAISPDDAQRPRKAFRIFLESVLLAELGQELISDPSFAAMVDKVHEQMEADDELAPALAEAARLLIGRATPGAGQP